jgi:hypothetical protein
MKKVIFAVLVGCVSMFAIEDSQENRAKETDRYLEVMSMKSIFKDAIEATLNAKGKSKEEAEQVRAAIDKYIKTDDILKELKVVMIKHYTADELSAMSDFYSTPLGKSIISKQVAVTMDTNEKMQAIIMKMVMGMMGDEGLYKKEKKTSNRKGTSVPSK